MLVTIHDVNDNEPIFDQSFYNVSVAENEAKGRCVLKVSDKLCNKRFAMQFCFTIDCVALRLVFASIKKDYLDHKAQKYEEVSRRSIYRNEEFTQFT